MSKREKRILLVDPDEKSRRILEVSLRKAGYKPVGARDAREAIEAIEAAPFDLVISETTLPDASGFDFCRRARSAPTLEGVPFVFMTRTHDMAEKLRGLELGVDEYLTKPVYVAEVCARVEMLLHRREAELLAEAQAPTVNGQLSDISVIDLFRAIEDGRKTGALRLEREGRRATVYFEDGQPVDARADLLVGEEAVYRLLAWNEGDFTLKVLPGLRRPRRIDTTFTDLVVEGLQRSEQFDAVSESVAAHEQVLRVDLNRLAELVDGLPEPVRELLRLFDGRRPTGTVIDDSPLGDLATIRIVQRLLDEGLLEVLRPLDEDEDEIEALAAVANVGLDDWLGTESLEQRAEREAREARRREEERRLKTELEQLQQIGAEIDGQLKAAEEARRVAEEASTQLHERQEEIRRRLTGELPTISDDRPAADFQPKPTTKRPTPSTPPEGQAAAEPLSGDWLGLASAAETEKPPRRGDEIDTFAYPALKTTADADEEAGNPAGFGSKRSRVDTNPRFRSDMAADAESRELTDLRESIDSERRRLQATRRKARDEERRATDSQRALQRVKNAHEELERAEEMRRLQSEQNRLEAERRALVTQRRRLQGELLAEREQLEREKERLRTAAAARRTAQEDEEKRLRDELGLARQQREEEEQRLAAQHREAERLKQEVARQEAALRQRSRELPSVAPEDVEEADTAAPWHRETTQPRRIAAVPPPIPKKTERPAEIIDLLGAGDDDGAPAASDAGPVTGPSPASLGSEAEPEPESADDRSVQAVEEARRRLHDAAARTEERLLGKRVETPGPSVPRATRTPSDTARRLAAIAESKRRLSTLVAGTGAESEPSDLARPSSTEPTPPAGVAAVTPPHESAVEASEPRPDDDAWPEPTAAFDEHEDLDHNFFSAEHDDLYAALYDEDAPSRTVRNLLFLVALAVAVFAIIIAIVSTDDSPSAADEPAQTVETVIDPGPSEEEVAARQSYSDARSRAAGDVDDAVLLALRIDPLLEAVEAAVRTVSAGLSSAGATDPAEDVFQDDLPLEPFEPGQTAAVLEAATIEEETGSAPEQPTPTEDNEEDDEPEQLVRREEPDEALEEGADEEALDVEGATDRARELMSAGEYGEAAAEAQQILEAEPANRGAHRILGESLLNLDEARDAIPHLEAATSSRRPDDHALMLLGNAQLDVGDQDAALTTYRRYIELYPDTDEARQLRDFLASQ